MFKPVKTVKRWYVLPITGKETFKVEELSVQLYRHVRFTTGTHKEKILSRKTILTNVSKATAEGLVFRKERHSK